MSKLRRIIEHEFRMVASTKAFIILTILGPFLILGVTVIPTVVTQRAAPKKVQIALLGASQGLYGRVAPRLGQLGIGLEQTQESRAQLDQKLAEGQISGYLVIPPDIGSGGSLELVTREVPDERVVSLLRSTISEVVVDERLRQAGLDAAQVTRLTAPLGITTTQITRTGQRVQQNFVSYILVGIAFTMMLYMTILLYGQSIGRAVVQEKISKTVEILLSSVRAGDLLFGKILGQVAASLLQYAVWIGMALIGVHLLGPSLGLTQLPQLSLSVLLYLLLFFLLGFFLYAAIYAALGAAAEDEQNLGQLSWPFIMLLVLPMVSVGIIVTAPDSTYSVFLSFFPPTAAIITFVRILLSGPPAWHIALSVGIQLASIVVVLLLATKIFRVGILMSGRRFNLADMLRWLRA
jgi:ABC-2 type transport system permease protein